MFCNETWHKASAAGLSPTCSLSPGVWQTIPRLVKAQGWGSQKVGAAPRESSSRNTGWKIKKTHIVPTVYQYGLDRTSESLTSLLLSIGMTWVEHQKDSHSSYCLSV